MPERRIVILERLLMDGPGKDRWFQRPGRLRSPWMWFDPEDVPFVDARKAEFELERVPSHWRVRRVVRILE